MRFVAHWSVSSDIILLVRRKRSLAALHGCSTAIDSVIQAQFIRQRSSDLFLKHLCSITGELRGIPHHRRLFDAEMS